MDTLVNRIKIWPNNISNAQRPVPDNFYDFDYNDEGLDGSLRGAERREFPERRDLRSLLDILRCK